MLGNKFRMMGAGERGAMVGLGPVGPDHPAVRQMAMQMGQDEPESEDNPEEEGKEPPNFREAEGPKSCGDCQHLSEEGDRCQKYGTPTDETMVCDDYESKDDGSEEDDSNFGSEEANEGGEY